MRKCPDVSYMRADNYLYLLWYFQYFALPTGKWKADIKYLDSKIESVKWNGYLNDIMVYFLPLCACPLLFQSLLGVESRLLILLSGQ